MLYAEQAAYDEHENFLARDLGTQPATGRKRRAWRVHDTPGRGARCSGDALRCNTCMGWTRAQQPRRRWRKQARGGCRATERVACSPPVARSAAPPPARCSVKTPDAFEQPAAVSDAVLDSALDRRIAAWRGPRDNARAVPRLCACARRRHVPASDAQHGRRSRPAAWAAARRAPCDASQDAHSRRRALFSWEVRSARIQAAHS